MNDYPRRRRLDSEPPKSGGIPLVPLIVLVILGGLLLGGLLTRFFGNSSSGLRQPAPAPSFTPLPGATESTEPTQTTSPTPTPTGPPLEPSPSASVKATALPASATRRPSPTPAATTVTPVAISSAAPKETPAVIIITPSPAASGAPAASGPATEAPKAQATATPALITGEASAQHASAIVRSYIGALANGDQSTAAGYLASGIPDESFINPNVNVVIGDLRAAANDDGSFTVTAQIQTAKGSYLETFTLKGGPYGMQITQHSATHM